MLHDRILRHISASESKHPSKHFVRAFLSFSIVFERNGRGGAVRCVSAVRLCLFFSLLSCLFNVCGVRFFVYWIDKHLGEEYSFIFDLLSLFSFATFYIYWSYSFLHKAAEQQKKALKVPAMGHIVLKKDSPAQALGGGLDFKL